jgi:prepilin-type N-terminal cleavage/methylation domain-containing protein
MNRRGVSLLEMMIVIAVIVGLTMLSMPVYRTYQVHSDLNLAAEQVMQGLSRAKLLSQSAEKDSPWGFYVPHGVLFRGTTYVNRDPAYDEIYPMPSTITLSGSSILETSYAKISGRPTATGSIVLTALDGEQRTVVVTIVVQSQGLAANQGATLTICHHAGTAQQTLTIVESTWPSYQNQYPLDTIGACPASSSSLPGGSSSSMGISDSSSTPHSSSVSSGNGGGGGGTGSNGDMVICHRPGTAAQATMTVQPSAWSGHQNHGDTVGACSGGTTGGSLCPLRYDVATDGSLLTKVSLSMQMKVIASQLTWGVGGPNVPITVTYTKDDGKKWSNLFNGHTIVAGDTDTINNIPAGSNMALKMQATYKQNGWLLYDQSYATNDGTDQTMILRRGDLIPTFISHSVSGQQDLRSILSQYLDASGHLTIDPSSLIVLTEYTALASPPPDAEDFQDAIFLVQLNGTPSCP